MDLWRIVRLVADLPSWLLFLTLAISPPAGLGLFILRAIARNYEKDQRNTQPRFAQSRPVYEYAPLYTQQAAAGMASAPAAAPANRPTTDQLNSNKWQKRLMQWSALLGVCLALVGAVNLADALGALAWAGLLDTVFEQLLPALAQLAAGGGLLWVSNNTRETRKLEKLLDNIVGEQDHIDLGELAAAAGLPRKRCRKLVQNAIDHGYFGADAYIDHRTGYLVVRGPAPEPAPQNPWQATPPPQPARENESETEALLRGLREVNDRIADPVMSAKVERLYTLSGRILQQAEEDGEKQAKLKKFVDYYLPTTLRLLDTYAELCRQGVQGENIRSAKESIERSTDLVLRAFETQLDKLFQADALDVSADIAALEGMLSMDGLAGGTDFAAPGGKGAP